jgi:hypothetical protein
VDVADLVDSAVRPVLHFLAIGALLFAGERWLARAPSVPQLAPASDEELLAAEARRIGLDRFDPVVRGRLVQNLRGLGFEGDADDLYREALALGMDASDVVVRRRLAERMEARLRAAAPVSEAEARRAWDRHPELWTRPATVRLTHVFLARDRGGDATAGRARALRARLLAEDVGPEAAPARGDPFLLGAHLPTLSRAELARQLGAAFADAAFAAPAGRWSEPVRSSYGVHLLWVHEREPPQPLSFDRVRARLEDRVRAQRGDGALRDALAALRAGSAR